MQEEMQRQLQKDIESGKIYGLRLIRVDNDVVHNNCYADMFDEIREITRSDSKRFFLKTRRKEPHYLGYNGVDYRIPDYSIPSFEYTGCEAYYQAFSYYDGKILRAVHEFPAAVNPEDQISVTEYEVIMGY